MTFPGPLHAATTVGRYRVHGIQAGGQKLDGGAMFGVVPRVLWERRIPPDERNRIQLGMRCLLIEHESGLLLVDSGAGNKETEKFHDIYGIENAGDPGPTALEDGIRAAGFTPQAVAHVISTHLHFDHAGGNTMRTSDGSVVPSFANARYYVQKGELEFARTANERTTASYFPPNFEPLVESGVLELLDGDGDVLPGIRVLRTPGHTPHHQCVIVEGGDGATACFLGDLVPTSAHLPLPWIMGYDVQPLVTLETKRKVLKQALDEDWLVVFEHDAHVAWGHVTHDGRNYSLRADPGD